MFARIVVRVSIGLGLGLVCCAIAAQASVDVSDGEVRRVDRDNQKVTIKHGEIKNLDMPPMSMVFQVRDPALLDKLKPGDKVRFNAEKSEGAFVVTAIEPKN